VKKIALILIIIVLLVISIPFINFMKLDIYDYDTNTNIISKDGIEYIASSLPSSVETEKTIGRCRNDKFLGFKTWIIKLKDVDEKEEFLVRGLMYEAVYKRKQ
jgi:hypothetical protein